MKSIIIGSSGNFSLQLQQLVTPENCLIIGKDKYKNGLEINLDLENHIAQINSSGEFEYLVNTVGVISKVANYKEIMLWNYEFPKYLYRVCQQTGLKLITLGSVHENYSQLLPNNLYLQSKFKLKEFLDNKDFKDSIHFQFHTWYGGDKIHEQMFLGQVINSIKHRSIFKLNSGDQKREYHHIEDDAKCLLKTLLKSSIGCYEISHGQPITLRDISNSIFSFFNCEDYLQISESPILAEYYINYDVFTKSNCTFRPTIEGMISYVQTKI